MESDPTPPTTVAVAAMPKRNCKTGGCRDLPSSDQQPGTFPTTTLFQTNHLQRRCPEILSSNNPTFPTQHHQQNAGQSVQAFNVSSVSLDNMFRVATLGWQITREFNAAVAEEEKIVIII
jgi:hypothetical protein